MQLADLQRGPAPWEAERQAAHARSDLSAGAVLLYDFLTGQAPADGRLVLPWTEVVHGVRPDKDSTVHGWRSELENAGLLNCTWAYKGPAGFSSRSRGGGLMIFTLRPPEQWRPDYALAWVRPQEADPQQRLLFSSGPPPALGIVPRTPQADPTFSSAGSAALAADSSAALPDENLTQCVAGQSRDSPATVPREVVRHIGQSEGGSATRPQWETPSSPARALTGMNSFHTDIPPSSVSARDLPAAAAAVGKNSDIPDAANLPHKADVLVQNLWPQGRGPITDRRDQRLIYRLCYLRLQAEHAEWIARLVEETAEERPKNPLARLQSKWPSFAPPGLRSIEERSAFLASIYVPAWAIDRDPRAWCAAADH